MTRYLVVAHQTALSEELLAVLREKARESVDVAFDVVVPATPVQHLLTWEEGETREIAARRAQDALDRLLAEGIRVHSASVGDPNPVVAVSDALNQRPGRFDGIIISTHPARTSLWLKRDAVNQICRLFGLPVTHLTARPRLPDAPADVQPCRHDKLRPAWDSEMNCAAYRCEECGELVPREESFLWKVWRP